MGASNCKELLSELLENYSIREELFFSLIFTSF